MAQPKRSVDEAGTQTLSEIKPELVRYRVYRQCSPVFDHKDKKGDSWWRAAFDLKGEIEATEEDAMAVARKKFRLAAPVLERVRRDAH